MKCGRRKEVKPTQNRCKFSKQFNRKVMGNKILFVDDSRPMLTLLSGLFRSDFEVACKQSAVDALNSIDDESLPDLIVTDINMPEMDGYEFVVRLKANPLYEHIPVMVLSSNQESADRIKLYKMGVDEYMIKPFNPEELRVKAEKIIDRKRVVKFEVMAAA